MCGSGKDPVRLRRKRISVNGIVRHTSNDNAWREAFAAAIERSPLNQADVARLIGRKQQQVSDWLAGRAHPPRPDVVFDIEDALGCPDELSRHLGYVRLQEHGTEAAIRQDPNLSPGDRDALLRFYEAVLDR